MVEFAPWFYRNLLCENEVISKPIYYKCSLIDNRELFEAVVHLNRKNIPSWLTGSDIYSDCDGSGASSYQNIALYKAISEALERWAFYQVADSENQKEFSFDENPSTTGIAAYPGITAKNARKNAIMEAGERWALHEFWRGRLPVREHLTNVGGLRHFEIITELKMIKISLLCYKNESQHLYAFAAGATIEESFNHALVELSRNVRVMKKISNTNVVYSNYKDISDKRLMFFSSEEGNQLFKEKIASAPKIIKTEPRLICDKEIKGPWTKYAKVWRYLYANSFPDSDTDHTFFMF